MQLTVELEGIDTLAKYLADGSEFEVSKETNQIFVKVDDQEDGAAEKTAVQQEEPVKAEKKEAADKPQITTAELRKAVMEFTRNNQDNLTKAKEILSGMGIEQLSQLEGDLIDQFVDKFVAIGGKI